MTEEDIDYPRYAFRVEDGSDAWALYRQTKTQERPIAARTDSRPFWFSLDRDDGNGDREPVRQEFLDAVAVVFMRAPGPSPEWDFGPIFDALTDYEQAAIDDLRNLRGEQSSARVPAEERDELVPHENPRSIPDDVWGLIQHARFEFTLSESLATKGDVSAKDRDEPLADEATFDDFQTDGGHGTFAVGGPSTPDPYDSLPDDLEPDSEETEGDE